MTNWMTGAGLALIAGGLATLISFRSVLFGGGERRAGRRQSRAVEAPQRPALPAPPPPPALDDVAPDPSRRGRRGRRRALVAATGEDDRGGLASIGLADDDEEIDPEPVPAGADRYGDRVDGWVRPEYHDQPEEPRSGEYWTPIPVDLAGDPEPSAKGYGWPRPVERLPAVPDYEPATGFDLIPISEPTEVVPVWPVNDDRPGRIRLPRSWATRNERPERRRPRPRPRPEPPADQGSTVYVSRHAADPPPRPD